MRVKKYQYRHIRAYGALGSVFIIFVLLVVLLLSNIPGKTPEVNLPTATQNMETTPTIDPQSTAGVTITNKAKIQMVGDLALRDVTLESAKKATGAYNFLPYFSEIKTYLDGDLKLLNLEGVLDGAGDGVYEGFPLYNYPAEIADAIADAGFNTVITANDHAFDKGVSGIANTRTILEQRGLAYVGTYENQEQYDQFYIKNVNGIKIGILAYSDTTNNMDTAIPEEQRPYAMRRINWTNREASLTAMQKDIKDCRAAGAEIVLLSLHWGTDLTDAPNSDQRWLAQNLAEAGADIIMGTLPHCVQSVTYKQFTTTAGEAKDVVIAYSLGNLLAHQTNTNIVKTQDGMLLNVYIERDEQGKAVITSAEYLPTYIYSRNVSTDSQKNIYDYRILAAGSYNSDTTRPAAFLTDAEWEKCKAAYTYVKGIVGNANGKLKVLTGELSKATATPVITKAPTSSPTATKAP